MRELSCDLLVLGAGPGGYATAIRAGQLGLDTVVVEAGQPGGTCLNVGCIPSKALLHAAHTYDLIARHARDGGAMGISAPVAPKLDLAATVRWKDSIVDRLTGGVGSLLSRSGVRTIHGWGTFRDGKTVDIRTDADEEDVVVRARRVVLATGSVPRRLPVFAGAQHVMTSTEALSLSTLPDTLLVVGGGYIGLELATVFAKLGSSVTIVEAADDLLPAYDSALTRPVRRRLNELGVDIRTGTLVHEWDDSSRTATLTTGDTTSSIEVDAALEAVGRRPNVDGWGLERLDLDRDGPFVRIDDFHRTSMTGVYAVGDLTGEPMLAHRAIAQGHLLAEQLAGHTQMPWDQRCIPAVVFTDPEIFSVGLSPDQAADADGPTTVAEFPFTASGRALGAGDPAGFVRVVARKSDHVILGAQGVGADVSELTGEIALAIEMGARLDDIAGTIHTHPTRSEATLEAALVGLGAGIHA